MYTTVADRFPPDFFAYCCTPAYIFLVNLVNVKLNRFNQTERLILSIVLFVLRWRDFSCSHSTLEYESKAIIDVPILCVVHSNSLHQSIAKKNTHLSKESSLIFNIRANVT